MIAASFEEANKVFDKPTTMSHDECESLSVLQSIDQNGNPVIVSCWKPTQEELDEITKTKRVWCIFYGTGIPPHCLSGIKPF